jgi:gluconokinase
VGRIVVFGRTLDKLRLHARGALPAEYAANLGEARPNLFDGRCCRFLGVRYEALRERALQGGCDEEILTWAHGRGVRRSDEECVVWNHYMVKLGWRDDRSDMLRQRAAEFGLASALPQTMFELLDADEGRPLGDTRGWESQPISTVVVMGVSGCGKTTVAGALSSALGWGLLEADTLHPPGNIAKMSAGVPLDDSDRAPWLASVRSAIEAAAGRGERTVAACSALRASYRQFLAPDPAGIRFVHLKGPFELIRSRLAARSGHYMGEGLLRSQFEALEDPVDALVLDASLEPGALVARTRETLGIP